jgi:predicted metal-dependent hydrolase
VSEQGEVRFGNTSIPYTIVRSTRRRKTVEITLDPRDGVLVAAPADTPPDRIEAIVRNRSDWIVLQASEELLRPKPKAFVSGESLPYLGHQARLSVERANVRQVKVAFVPWSFHISVPMRLIDDERRAAIGRALIGWYRKQAADHLAETVNRWSVVAGYRPSAVQIRDQRQRWGSCSPTGVLRFNWRIVMAPPVLMNYVVVHELAHLRFRTHTAAFWAEVGRVLPDCEILRMRLKEVGATLTL